MTVLEGKRALITGAAKRMGKAIAHALAAKGAHIVVHYRGSQREAEHLAGTLRDQGVHAWTVQADLADPEAARAMFAGAVEQAGAIDILVNNASIFPEQTFEETDWQAVEMNMRVNAYAPLVLGRAFAAQKRSGAIVNLLDTMVRDYDRKHVPYHLSKRMLATLTRMMAVECAPDTQVNAVAPGLVLPPEGKDLSYLEGLAHTNLLQSHGESGDVARAVVFLCENAFITGQTIYVDGGRHLKGCMYE